MIHLDPRSKAVVAALSACNAANPNVPESEQKNRANRLLRALELIQKTGNFTAAFSEYSARLQTGHRASQQMSSEAGRKAQAEAIAKSVGGNKEAEFAFASRVAETATWYEKLALTAKELNCKPSLVEYLERGIPEALADLFFQVQTPPANAAVVYRMIYPETPNRPATLVRREGKQLDRMSVKTKKHDSQKRTSKGRRA